MCAHVELSDGSLTATLLILYSYYKSIYALGARPIKTYILRPTLGYTFHIVYPLANPEQAFAEPLHVGSVPASILSLRLPTLSLSHNLLSNMISRLPISSILHCMSNVPRKLIVCGT